jgi:putative transposase
MSFLEPPARIAYPSDLTDAEWEIIAPMIPSPIWLPGLQEPKHTPLELMNAIRYRVRTGCAWRSLPHDFPPWSTVQKCFYRWMQIGVFETINKALIPRVRVEEGRKPEPTAGSIDSQSVKSSGNGGPGGFDGGKKVNGRKRHIFVDVLGLVLALLITPANVQDRDAAVPVLTEVHKEYPTIELAWVDGAYNGKPIEDVKRNTGLNIETIQHKEGHRGFAVLPSRWVVERTNAWFGRFRILNKEYERSLASSRADVLIAMSVLMLRHLTVPASDRLDAR